MKKLLATALLGATISLAAAASASAAVVTLATSTCSLEATSCRFNGNANVNKSYEIDNAYNGQAPSPVTALSLSTLLSGSVDASALADDHAGTDTANFLVSYFAVKAGNEFLLYKLDTPSFSFDWSTAGLTNKKGKEHDVSHIAFWGSEPLTSGVPEPTTWALLISGFGLAGASLRRRRVSALAA